jgi:type I restriction enzyme S subunit
MMWGTAQIAKTCLRTRMRDPRRNPNKPFLYVDISAIDRGLKVITSAPEILGADAPSRARKEICEGDVLVSTVRPNLNAVAVVPPDLDGQIASTGFCVLRPNRAAIVGKYLFYFTTTPNFVGILSSKVRGAHYPAVSDGDVKEIELPLPTLSEQRRIVEILDQADALRKKHAEADAKAARILPALFYKMFGDPATNPKGWPVKPLGDITIGKPQYGANASAIEWSVEKPRYVRITDITGDGRLLKDGVMTLDLDDWEPYRLVPGDILFARSGNTVGKTYLYRPKDGLCAYAGYLIRFNPDTNQVEPWYLFSLTQTDYYRNWVEARKRVAGQPNINGREYASIRIPCPPVPLQQQFAGMVEELIGIRDSRGTAVEEIGHLLDVLLHRAFTGDLTAKWREAHMKELLAEMKTQAKYLNLKETSL